MKRIFAVLMLALPLGVSVLAQSASAAEFNPNFNGGREGSPARVVVVDRHTEARRPEVRRVWVAGHFQPTSHGHRQWVSGHFELRRV